MPLLVNTDDRLWLNRIKSFFIQNKRKITQNLSTTWVIKQVLRLIARRTVVGLELEYTQTVKLSEGSFLCGIKRAPWGGGLIIFEDLENFPYRFIRRNRFSSGGKRLATRRLNLAQVNTDHLNYPLRLLSLNSQFVKKITKLVAFLALFRKHRSKTSITILSERVQHLASLKN